jgi:hypothetical protein
MILTIPIHGHLMPLHIFCVFFNVFHEGFTIFIVGIFCLLGKFISSCNWGCLLKLFHIIGNVDFASWNFNSFGVLEFPVYKLMSSANGNLFLTNSYGFYFFYLAWLPWQNKQTLTSGTMLNNSGENGYPSFSTILEVGLP